ncbi:hypothetical protein I4U23_022478 [Adineta vaga]|nr:hypothetical protein I4U23_022478 [Adineta vaga]
MTNGDTSGILICFVAFIFCSIRKGRLRSYMQRIQTHAQCIVLYGSQRVELKYIQRLLSTVCNSMLIGSISFALVNFPIQFSFVITGLCTYTMPSVIFFFIRKTQSPELARNLLTAIPFYSILINLLSQLIFILEFALITVTMGNHLWMILDRLEKLAKQHQTRIAYEKDSGIRQEDSNMFILRHLNISVSGVIGAPLLQSQVNLEAIRGQCILVSGPSGCGKTSLFRICAGLQSIDAKQIILPTRHHLLLRFQALFLVEDQRTINDRDLFQLFRSVNLLYLLERHTLDMTVDWSLVLSMGEQQRLSFVRLLALFTLAPNKNQLVQETLVFFDESTSAIDIKTEREIYRRLSELCVWFVTISHRSSLVHLHTKGLQFFPGGNCQQTIEPKHMKDQVSFTSTDEEKSKHDFTETKQSQNANVVDNCVNIPYTYKKNTSGWKLIVDIIKFMHLPFQSNDKKLIVETIIAWLLSLIMAGVDTWSFYTFINRTAILYNGLSGYASGSISLNEAKQSIKSDIVSYVLIVLVIPVSYSLSAGGGRALASLYTRRQLNYLSHLLLDNFEKEHTNNLLYYSRHMSTISNIFSNEIAEMNTEVFNLLFGQVYYVGIIINLQAEQIALLGENVCIAEENELRQKLDSSVHSQMRYGYFFSIIVSVARLCVENTSLVSYGIPAAIFFHTYYSQGVRDPITAQTFITLSVYMFNLYSSVSFITYFSDPLTRIQSIGMRLVNELEQLRQINIYHRHLATEEQARKQRVFIESKLNEPSLVFEQVDVRIPYSSHVLISNINLILHSSDNLIITGPSGCGKSTLLLLLGGVIFNKSDNKNSVLRIIPRQNIIILCQQLHLIRGTLREQLSYLRLANDLDSVTDDNYVQLLLNELSLGHLIDRYSMDGEKQVWSEMLSIGEQQRLMMVTAFLVGTETVRLFILDETTSGCDKQTEKAIYEHLQRSNVQFISISHRKEINIYHSCQMTIDTGHN